MNEATIMVLVLIAHFWGDYVLQNHWMANKKTSSSWACAIHVITYCLPFEALMLATDTWSWPALMVIGGTHFIIDRWQLASYWVRLWGVGVGNPLLRKAGYQLARRLTNTGMCLPLGNMPADEPNPPEDAPAWLAVWLKIIVDNTWHLTINALAMWGALR